MTPDGPSSPPVEPLDSSEPPLVVVPAVESIAVEPPDSEVVAEVPPELALVDAPPPTGSELLGQPKAKAQSKESHCRNILRHVAHSAHCVKPNDRVL